MPLAIEDYALIGDMQTAALVGRDGSIDWLCLPRFDSGACFAALLGHADHGRWVIAPADPRATASRRYRPDTLVLETEWASPEGRVRVTDFMPPRGRAADVVRIVEGLEGRVRMRCELVIRFDYGHVVPWVRRHEGATVAVAGPDALYLDTPAPVHGEDLRTVAEWDVAAGDAVPFVLTWSPSHESRPPRVDATRALADTERVWREWAAQATVGGPNRDLVVRSLITLKAMTYAPTGGIVAAVTTSLPEQLGGVRNWDYRYTWVRDAALTLWSMLEHGYTAEARAWRDWLLRAVAGDPATMQILYGPAGERRIAEYEVPWLPGYEGSAPVRVGNAASGQFQLDVYGEVMDTLDLARDHGLSSGGLAWNLQTVLLDFLESRWDEPDEGIWEIRGAPRHFVYSKVMAWVAFDRAVRGVERHGLEGPVDRWRRARAAVHREVCEKGWDAERGTFTQSYGSRGLDASVLQIPLVGFLPPDDPRVASTVDAVRRELDHDGFLLRYATEGAEPVDGLPPGEAAFLPCTFWLVDDLVLIGRRDEARAVFERLAGLANDVGLLSEEYDAKAGRLVGNFPQAFTHVGLANSAKRLEDGA